MEIKLRPIGYINTPYDDKSNIPRQAVLNTATQAKIVLDKKYTEGLKGIEKGDFIELIFYFHESEKEPLTIKSMRSGQTLGVFATRAPHRPNHIGVSIVKVVDVVENVIDFKGVDMLNGTPILDIKPMNEGLELFKK